MDPFIHNLSCVMICKGTLFHWYSEVTILHVWPLLTFGLSLLVTFNYYKKKKAMHYPTLPAKTLCSIPSTHLQGFRNYIATILKSYLRGMSIILLGLLCAVQCHVTCCIVMFCCFPLLTVGDILLPVFFIVRICSSAGVVISRVLTVGATLVSVVLNIQATILVAFSRVLTVWATQFLMVLTVQATMLLAFSQVLTVWATLFSRVLTVQATMFLAVSWVLTVLATLFRTVLTVQATMLLLVMWASATPFWWC